MKHYQALQTYNRANLCALPCNLSDKYPSMLTGWRKYINERPSDYDLKIWRNYADGSIFGVCLICGKISGGLEVIDIDNHLGNASAIFKEFISIDEVSAVISANDIPIEQTKNGGYHFFFKSSKCEGNQKLAVDQKKTIIETRGEGGLIVCAPSVGYDLLSGDLSNIPTISADDREILINYCKSFDKSIDVNPDMRQVAIPETATIQSVKGERPGDIYNRENVDDAKRLLLSVGWVNISGNHWRRPGKKNGVSATFGHIAQDVFYVFSSNAPNFESGKCYHPFDIYTILEHNGNYTSSAKVLAERFNMPKRGREKKQKPQIELQNDDLNDIDLPIWAVKSNGKIKIDYYNTKLFLERNGFARYEINSKKYMFINVKNGIVEECNFLQVRDFILNYLLTIKRGDVYNEFIDSGKFNESNINIINVIEIEWLRDNKESAYLFYQNCIVDIRASGIYLRNYGEIPGFIWRSQILNRDFELLPEHDFDSCDVARFCAIVSDNNEQRIAAYRGAIGYLLHTFKKASFCPVICFNDENITDDPTGGTGKGLSVRFIEQMRNVVTIDGKNFDIKNQFAFQRVNQDSNVIFIDDIVKGFNFESLFSIVTTGIATRKLYLGEIFIPFALSPKWVLTTNYAIKSIGESFTRRLFEIEIHKHFSSAHTPADEFGRETFTEWDSDEWARFDNWMVASCRGYLAEGLKKPTYITLEYNKLKASTHRDFVPFAEDYLSVGRYVKRDIIQKFREITDDRFYINHLGTRKFCDWCEKWAEYNKWTFDRDCGSGRSMMEFSDGSIPKPIIRIGTVAEPITNDEMPF